MGCHLVAKLETAALGVTNWTPDSSVFQLPGQVGRCEEDGLHAYWPGKTLMSQGAASRVTPLSSPSFYRICCAVEFWPQASLKPDFKWTKSTSSEFNKVWTHLVLRSDHMFTPACVLLGHFSRTRQTMIKFSSGISWCQILCLSVCLMLAVRGMNAGSGSSVLMVRKQKRVG